MNSTNPDPYIRCQETHLLYPMDKDLVVKAKLDGSLEPSREDF